MADMTRELGVSNTECSGCGSSLAAIEQADGSVAYETCSTCYPSSAPAEPEPEQAQFQSTDDVFAGREYGTTHTDEGDDSV